MKLTCYLLPLCGALAIALLSSAQDSKKPANGSAEEHADHMDEPPGPANQKLAQRAGKYVAKTKFDMGNGAPAMESTGEATFESMLGGRFLLQRETNTMMEMPFESLKLYGFNTSSGRYEGTWTYSGSTAVMSLNGTSTDGGKTITFGASYEGKDRKRTEYEIILREIDADRFSTTLRDKSHGSSFETTYSRAR